LQTTLSKDKVEHALALHKKSVCVDTHNHIDCEDDIEERTSGGLDCKFYLGYVDTSTQDFYEAPPGMDNFGSCYESEGHFRKAIGVIDRAHLDIEKHNDKLALALNAEEVVKNKKEGKLSVVLGFEGAKALDGSLSNLRTFYRLGLRHLGLTHGFGNQLSGGQWDPDNGLTNFGKAAVAECNRLGIIVDTAHISEPGMAGVLEISKDPIIIGHSGAKALCAPTGGLSVTTKVSSNPKSGGRQPQLLWDEQIKEVHEKGGVIGLHFFARVMTGRDEGGVEVLLNHTDYIAKLVGSVDSIGIGTDFYPRGEPWLTYMDTLIRRKRRVEGDSILRPKLLLEDASKMPEFTVGLVERGYSDDEVEKILGGNVLRVMKAVTGA